MTVGPGRRPTHASPATGPQIQSLLVEQDAEVDQIGVAEHLR